MKIAVFAFVALLSACVTASEVVPIGPGQYIVTGHASGGLNAGKGVGAAAEKANVFCASRHKILSVDKTETHGMAAVGGESNSITFRCVEPAP